MQTNSEHVSEEILERYSLGTLSGVEEETLEEHLLVCPNCQNRLTEADIYVRAMRSAASRLRSQQAQDRRRFPAGWFAPLARPKLAFGAAVVFCLVLLFWVAASRQPPRASGLPQIAVVLQTVRGADRLGGARAPGRHPLLLQADLSGLPPQNLCELEVVDARGTLVSRSPAVAHSGRAEAPLNRGLAAGQYWVRLYCPNSPREPLREYALRVE